MQATRSAFAGSSLAALIPANLLQHRLDAAFPAQAHSRAVVGLHVCGETSFAATGTDPAYSHSITLGCTTKLLTAAAVRLILRERGLLLDSPLGAVFANRRMAGVRILERITFRQLLEHSHGLDGSCLDAVPRRRDGFLDPHALIAQLEQVEPLAIPGALSSYGEVGAWLAALAIEQATGKRFGELLWRVLRADLEHGHAARSTSSGICPATGGGLSIATATLMGFLCDEMQPGVAGLLGGNDPASVAIHVQPRAGWSAVDQGVYLSWAYYGHGWFGHNSAVPRSPVMVRINPQQRVAMIVSTDGVNPTLVAARLFARLTPELFRINSPGLVGDQQITDTSLLSFQGYYATQRRAFRLQMCGKRSLAVLAYERDAQHGTPKPFATATLVPGSDNVLLSRAAHPRLARFFQLIVPGNDGFRYLWDGESVFPRTAHFQAS